MEADESVQYVPVVNREEQYSLWSAGRTLPAGWRVAGDAGTRAEVLEYIGRVWTDMRPLSVRRQMEGRGADAGKSPGGA
jgi:MbtH protein